MKRRPILGIIVIASALAVVIPGFAVRAAESPAPRLDGQRVEVCQVHSGKIIRVAPPAARNSRAFTEDLTRCGRTDGDALAGGILATFAVGDEQFRVWVTNPATIEQILALQAGTSTASIPNGVIHYGSGAGGHNAPWSWHLDPEQIEMADFTTEVCDAAPSYVEENLDEFVEVVGRYCPWGATLVTVEDYR